jgi:cytochrome c oxidase subunit I+III
MNAPALFLLGFMFIFVLGGLTGVMVAVMPFDWQVHDTYFIVAHLHYVLIGGMVFPVFAAMYYWLPLVNGNRMSERWRAGCSADVRRLQPRLLPDAHHRPARHAAPRLHLSAPRWAGAAEPGLDHRRLRVRAGVLLFCRRGAHAAPAERRRSATRGTRHAGMAAVRGLRQPQHPESSAVNPLWDQPALAREVEAKAALPAGTATGRRETIATSPVQAKPRYLLVLPGDSWLPLLAAAGTAAFFLLLTVKLTVPAWICGIVGGRVGAGLAVGVGPRSPCKASPGFRRLGAAGRRRGKRLALLVGDTIIMLVVDASIFASFGFAYIHVSMRLQVCPPPGASLPPLAHTAVSGGCWPWVPLLVLAGRTRSLGKKRLPWLVLAALACACSSFALDMQGCAWPAWTAAPAPGRGDFGAGRLPGPAHRAAADRRALPGAARLVRPPGRRSRATLDNIALIWHYTTLQGIARWTLIRLMPVLME